jgi:phage virion morphogenesis protein
MRKIDITFSSGTVMQVLTSLIEWLDDLSEPMNDIAAVLESATESAFEAEADPATGQAWASLSDAYLKAKLQRQGGKILQMSAGGLAASVTAESDDFWAAIHQSGGTDDMPTGPADIPARPYLGVSTDDEQSMLSLLSGCLVLVS